MDNKYDVVVSDLKKRIINGEFDQTKKIPTENQLVDMYNVSKNTIRKAIEVLEVNGFVYKVQGSGVFLREVYDKKFYNVSNMNALFANIMHYNTTVKVLIFEVIKADDFLADKLKCSKNTEIYHVKRLRFYKDEAYDIEESFFNKDIIIYLNEEICSGSIFNYTRYNLKLIDKFANRVVSCEKLNKQDAELLRLEENDPCLKIENTTFLNNGRLFDYSTDIYNYKMIKLYNSNTY